MKVLAFIFSIVLFSFGETIDMVSWDSTHFDFGEIQQNIPATASYELTNNSDIPLVIEDVKVGCGCTSSNYSKEAVLPGETTVIEAIFNAKKAGKFTKTASVQTNVSDKPTVLSFKGVVVSE